MRNHWIQNLAECTEFRQTLQARPPRIIHGTALLLAGLLGGGLLWAGLTRVNLVVRAVGRVRPVTPPIKVYNTGSGETFSASFGGRVIPVNFREGDKVRKGDVLIRLDTERLDNEIIKRKQALQAAEEDLAKLDRLKELLAHQFEAARARAEAELAQAREDLRLAQEKRGSGIRPAGAEAGGKGGGEERGRQPHREKTTAEARPEQAILRVREAEEKLKKAELPVDEGRVEVLRRGLVLAEKDHAVRGEELGLKRAAKQAEVNAARVDLDNLELERKQ